MKYCLNKLPVAIMVCSSLVLTTRGNDADPIRKNVLSTNEIAALQTQVPGTLEGETIRFSASFTPLTRLSARDRSRHADAGTIPFRITADYVQLRMGSNNRMLSKRLPGTVHAYVADGDGKIVASQSMLVERMCPT